MWTASYHLCQLQKCSHAQKIVHRRNYPLCGYFLGIEGMYVKVVDDSILELMQFCAISNLHFDTTSIQIIYWFKFRTNGFLGVVGSGFDWKMGSV